MSRVVSFSERPARIPWIKSRISVTVGRVQTRASIIYSGTFRGSFTNDEDLDSYPVGHHEDPRYYDAGRKA